MLEKINKCSIYAKNKKKMKVIFNQSLEVDKENQPYQKKHQSAKNLIDELISLPISTKNTMMLEMRCLMSQSQIHQSYLLHKKLISEAKAKLSHINTLSDYKFSQDKISKFLQVVNFKPNDSTVIIECFKECIQAYNYPPSIKLLMMYMGTFIYQMNGMYDMAEQICRKFFSLVVRIRIDQYFLIHLILMVKIKSNLGQWQSAIKVLMKLLAFSWLYKLVDLQIWCYFELSRAYFFNHQQCECQFFRKKSEMNVVEPQGGLYRQIIEKQLSQELENIKQHNYYFDMNIFLPISRLKCPPPGNHNQHQTISKRNLQTLVKKINEQCKIRYVKNLLPRIDGNRQANIMNFSGNPHFTTHNSRNKNLNMYFRIKKNQINKPYIPMYTMENSTKSWAIIKQMVRTIVIEMRLLNKQKF